MHRLIVLIGTVFVLNCAFSQITEEYYDLATGKSGDELKAILSEIIEGHSKFPYTAGSIDVWDILKESDRDPNNADNVILVYTKKSVNAKQEYNSGAGWSREHVWAKSRGDFGTRTGTGTDLHNLKPADVSINSLRSNRSFSTSIQAVFDEGLNTGCLIGNGFTFEPHDAVKGDIARIIFYMATRYEGSNGELDLDPGEEILDSRDKSPKHGVLSELINWHNSDSVDDFERNRNDVIFKYQGNRNPYIDHPEWVESIWGVNTDIPKNYSISKKNTQNNQITLYDLSGKKLFIGTVNEISTFHIKNKHNIFILQSKGESTLINWNSLIKRYYQF